MNLPGERAVPPERGGTGAEEHGNSGRVQSLIHRAGMIRAVVEIAGAVWETKRVALLLTFARNRESRGAPFHTMHQRTSTSASRAASLRRSSRARSGLLARSASLMVICMRRPGLGLLGGGFVGLNARLGDAGRDNGNQ